MAKELDELKSGLEALKTQIQAIAGSLAGDKPVSEHAAEAAKNGDAALIAGLAASIAKLDEISKTVAEKLEVKPLIEAEALEALKVEAETGKVAVAQLAEMKAQEVLATRLAELSKDELRLEGELADAQATEVKDLSDESFVSYKAKLAGIQAGLKKKSDKMEMDKKEKEEMEKKMKKEHAADSAATPAKADLSAAAIATEEVNKLLSNGKSDESRRSLYAQL